MNFNWRPSPTPPPPPTEQELADHREREAQNAAYIQAVRQRQQQWRDKVAADEKARLDADRAVWAERNRKREEQHALLQEAVQIFGKRRRELEAEVAELRGLADGAAGVVARGELEDAVRAVALVEVYRVRLAAKEAELKQFLRSAPA